MVFFIEHKEFDFYKKRILLAILIVMMSSQWLPISRDLFLGLMNSEIGGGITVGAIISLLGVIGALGLVKKWF